MGAKRMHPQPPPANKRKRNDVQLSQRRILCITQPTYQLFRGRQYNLRHRNREVLGQILQKLVKQHAWAKAAAVLAVFVKATCKDTSAATNRFKYLVSMQLLKHIGSGDANFSAICRLYDTWMTRIGINLSSRRRNSSLTKQDIFVVRLESILSYLLQGNVEDQRQNARSLMQVHGFESHSVFNMIIGLIFYQLWYSRMPSDVQWKDSNQICTPTHSDMMSPAMYSYEGGESEGHNAVFNGECATSYQYDSDSSVMKDKKISVDAARNFGIPRQPVKLGVTMQVRDFPQHLQRQGFYANSEDDMSVDAVGSHMAFGSVGSWLLPLRTENLELDRIMQDDEYKNAVRYLQEAVHSTPPLLAALLPLTQLLLIGGSEKDALSELEKFCGNSSAAFPFRIRAKIMECVNPHNSVILATSYEDALRSDPSCSQTLAKLLSLHHNGDYSPKKMLEMIALHLEADFPGYNTWREFASCFLKVYQLSKDRWSCVSSIEGGQNQMKSACYHKIPWFFEHGKSASAWRLRHRWWLTRHFSMTMLASEIATGDLGLLTYKAACASHLYGPEFKYVVRTRSCLEKARSKDLFLFLQEHIRSTIGLHKELGKRRGRYIQIGVSKRVRTRISDPDLTKRAKTGSRILDPFRSGSGPDLIRITLSYQNTKP